MQAARALRVPADQIRELENLAKPLLPKPIVVREEQENTAPSEESSEAPPMNTEDHDIRELLEWDELDKVWKFDFLFVVFKKRQRAILRL